MGILWAHTHHRHTHERRRKRAARGRHDGCVRRGSVWERACDQGQERKRGTCAPVHGYRQGRQRCTLVLWHWLVCRSRTVLWLIALPEHSPRAGQGGVWEGVGYASGRVRTAGSGKARARPAIPRRRYVCILTPPSQESSRRAVLRFSILFPLRVGGLIERPPSPPPWLLLTDALTRCNWKETHTR